MRLFHRDQKITSSELRGIMLVASGCLTLAYYLSWWFIDGRYQSPWLLAALLIAIAYSSIQIVGSWILYLATHRRATRRLDSAHPLTVDVFITAYNEDIALIERALTAAVNMHSQKRVWLLDDSDNPTFAALAQRLGVGYLTREGAADAKAGNINAALSHTDGDIIAIFDIDHAPRPTFLSHTVDYFSDPNVGFVQVMLTFENDADGWVAQAAAETSLDFYNPTCIGADALQGATLVGSNALIRRAALEDIGGYRPGLAEDLATSVALHAAGWQSVYVAEPLAPGMAPPDLSAWFIQQLKWARGVFELLLTAYPHAFSSFTAGQRITYLVRMTYYWAGPIFALHLLTSFLVLWSGRASTLASYQSYLLHLAPLASMFLLVRLLALRRWRHPALRSQAQLRAVALVAASWPAYTWAWLLAVCRLPLAFRPTPKEHGSDMSWRWMVVWLLPILLLLSGLIYSGVNLSIVQFPVLIGFVLVQISSQALFLLFWILEYVREHVQRPLPSPSADPLQVVDR